MNNRILTSNRRTISLASQVANNRVHNREILSRSPYRQLIRNPAMFQPTTICRTLRKRNIIKTTPFHHKPVNSRSSSHL